MRSATNVGSRLAVREVLLSELTESQRRAVETTEPGYPRPRLLSTWVTTQWRNCFAI